MFVKVHERHGSGRVLAACDEDLIGRVLKQGSTVLDLDKYAGFYKGEKASEEELVELLRNSDNVNLVGEKTLKAAARVFKIGREVKRINGVPCLQIYRV